MSTILRVAQVAAKGTQNVLLTGDTVRYASQTEDGKAQGALLHLWQSCLAIWMSLSAFERGDVGPLLG